MAQGGKRLWDPWKMYDASTEEMRAIRERAKMREALKAEWTKKYTNPWKSKQGGGHLFDPALQRFIALKNTQAEYFKGTFRQSVIAFCLFVVPVSFLTWHINYTEREKEAKYRSGQVMYKDRRDKFFA